MFFLGHSAASIDNVTTKELYLPFPFGSIHFNVIMYGFQG